VEGDSGSLQPPTPEQDSHPRRLSIPPVARLSAKHTNDPNGRSLIEQEHDLVVASGLAQKAADQYAQTLASLGGVPCGQERFQRAQRRGSGHSHQSEDPDRYLLRQRRQRQLPRFADRPQAPVLSFDPRGCGVHLGQEHGQRLTSLLQRSVPVQPAPLLRTLGL
jgi:hypothetical protein